MLRGNPRIIKEIDGIILGQWGSEYFTGIRDIGERLREVHFFNAVYDKNAQQKAEMDYYKRTLDDFFIIDVGRNRHV